MILLAFYEKQQESKRFKEKMILCGMKENTDNHIPAHIIIKYCLN